MLPTAAAASPPRQHVRGQRAGRRSCPFVPVTATQRLSAALSRQANSTSLITSADTAAAAS